MISLFKADTTDFSGNGMMALDRHCTRCQINEILNGDYTLDMELTTFAGMEKVLSDMVVRVPAPVRATPYIEVGGKNDELERKIYRIKVTTSNERNFTYIYTKPRFDYQYAIKRLHNGTEYEYVEKVSDYFHRAIAADGTSGYILNGDGEYVRSEGGYDTPSTVVPARQTRDQLFRIRKITPTLDGIVIYAKHISYDLQENYLKSLSLKNVTPAVAVTKIMETAEFDNPFTIYTNMEGTLTADLSRTDPLSALLDGDNGLVGVLGGQVLRDNFDIFWLKNIGKNRGASIAYRKNMTGMDITTDESDVVTRVIPVGYDKDGNPIYLSPIYVDSPLAGAYSRPRGVVELDCRNVKIGEDYADKEAVREELKKQAAAYFDGVVDAPSVQGAVEWVEMSKTNQGAGTPQILVYLGDIVTIRHEGYKLDLLSPVVAYCYDVLRDMYVSTDLGEVKTNIKNIKWAAKNLKDGTISARKIAAGSISGEVIAQGSIGTGHISAKAITGDLIAAGTILGDNIAAGTIDAGKIAADAITTDKLHAGAVTTDKLAAGSVTSESGVIGSINADKITAGKLSTDRLIVGGEEFSIVRALNQLKNAQSNNDSTIDGGVLTDGTIAASKVTDDFGAGLEISSNAAILLLSGKLDGTNSHMELTENAINMVGGEINIATDDMQISGMQDGNEIMSLAPDGLSADRVVVRRAFFAPNAVLIQPSSVIEWKGSIQSSLDNCQKYLTQDATLVVPAGTYQEDVRISGFSGSSLTVKFSPGVYLNGTVSILCCTSVTLTADTAGDACIYPGYAAESTVTIRDCARVVLKNLQISGYRERTGADNGSAAACASTGSFLYAEGCSFEYGKNGLSISQGQGYVNGCIGGTSGTNAATNANLEYGVYASCEGRVSLSGNFPRGGKAGYGVYRSVIDTYDLGSATSGGMTMPGDEYITRTFTPSKHCTYAYGVQRYRDDQTALISQGRYGSYSSASLGWRIGCLWYAEAVSALAGKTIRSATLTLRRASGGWSNDLPVYLGTVSLLESDYATTLKPEFTQSGGQPDFPAGSLGKESEGVFDVTGLMSALVSGGAIAVNEPRSSYSGTWSPAYTNFYGKGSAYEPVLTVEYK